MSEEIKARYRNKVGKIIIEVWNGSKWLYVKTLGDPLTEFKSECLAKVSSNKPKIDIKEPEKFVYQLLNELDKQDTPIEITPDLIKKARDAQEQIEKEIHGHK